MRDLRIIEGYLDELLENPNEPVDDYIQINLLDEGALLDPIGKLRQIYPNILHLERIKRVLLTINVEKLEDIIKKDDADLFAQFFHFAKGKTLNEQQQAIITKTLKTMSEEEA